jgi:hypothetical protein
MKPNPVSIGQPLLLKKVLFGALLVFLAAFSPTLVFAQWDFPPPTTSDAQRNALNSVRSQVNWLQNNTRTASNLVGDQGYGSLRREFEVVRLAYVELGRTLTPQQLERGADSLAELNDGLDIIQGAFANYEEDVAGGKSSSLALSNLCGVLREGSGLWLRELDRAAAQLRIGWKR